MNRTPLISIITPVYNVEAYIYQYLHSVLNQTYRNLEIICIDDGSPDRSGIILDKYAVKDSRLRVIHQANGGYAEAINVGLDNINGDYVGFVDPDDWVELNYYEDMLEIAERRDVDIVISNFFREFSDRSELMKNDEDVSAYFDDRNIAFQFGFEADTYRGFKMFLWNKLFKAKFFTRDKMSSYGFRMKKRTTGGDVELTTDCFLRTKRFAYIPKPNYHYRIRENSSVRSTDFDFRVGLNYALESITKKLQSENYPAEIINLVKRFHTYYSSQLAEFAYQMGEKKKLAFSKDQIQRYLSEYIMSNAMYPDRLERIERILKLEV